VVGHHRNVLSAPEIKPGSRGTAYRRLRAQGRINQYANYAMA
jgi:hypothetical protein